MKRQGRILITLGGVVVVCLLIIVVYQKYKFPYGHRPAAMRSMYWALLNYAKDHDGWFPESEAGPSAALEKLYPEYCPSGRELAGLSGNIEHTVEALRKKQGLSVGVSSWVYTPGLRADDPPTLAILWDEKPGIFANGRRAESGTRAVMLIGGEITNVSHHAWTNFLLEQRRMVDLARRRVSNNVPVNTSKSN